VTAVAAAQPTPNILSDDDDSILVGLTCNFDGIEGPN